MLVIAIVTANDYCQLNGKIYSNEMAIGNSDKNGKWLLLVN